MSKKTKKGGQFEQWSPWEPEVKSVFVLLFSLFFLALPAVSVGLKKKEAMTEADTGHLICVTSDVRLPLWL